MFITRRMQELAARKLEIRSLLETDEKAELETLEKELRAIEAELETLEKRKKAIDAIGNDPATSVVSTITQRAITETQNEIEDRNEKLYRSAWLKSLQGKELAETEKRAFSTASGSALSAIPTATANEIMRKIYEVAPIVERIRMFKVPGNLKVPVEGEIGDAAIHTENAAITATTDTLVDVSLTGYEIVKLVKASRASKEMTIDAFESYIVQIVAESIARRIEKYIFLGTGSSQPGGVAQGGKGTNGAYANGTDQLTIAAATDVTEADIVSLYSMLGSGYEREAIWTMSKITFFSYFYQFMNKSKNNVVEFANGKYYIMGVEVYFTGSLTKGVAYLGNFRYIIGNFAQDINVVSSEHSGLSTNSIDYLGACLFDSKAAAGLGAFVKFIKTQA